MKNLLSKLVSVIILTITLQGCQTYQFSSDKYVLGLRWFDRGAYGLAVEYWEPLLNTADCDVEYRMGLLHLMGVHKGYNDPQKIREYIGRAAQGGHSTAAIAHGDFYYQGTEEDIFHICKSCGYKKDYIEALKWYLVGQKNARYRGQRSYSKDMIGLIKSKMAPAQIAESKKRASEWQPTRLCKMRDLW